MGFFPERYTSIYKLLSYKMMDLTLFIHKCCSKKAFTPKIQFVMESHFSCFKNDGCL